jgi:hypothetical protein
MLIPVSAGHPRCVRSRRAISRTAARSIHIARWCAILVLPLWFGGAGLFAGFTADDMMNLYGYWSRPLEALIRANILPFTPYYRPADGIFYLSLFHLAGLDPLPYRVVCYALLLCNTVLLFRLARELTASRETAFLAALLAAHHRGYIDFHYNTGTV